MEAPEQGSVVAYVFTRERQKWLEHVRLSSSQFASYEDKERFIAVNEGFEALAKEKASSLSPALREEVELCAQYLLEQRDLDAQIKYRVAKESLDLAIKECRALEQKARPGIIFSALGGLLALVGLTLLIGSFSSGSEENKHDNVVVMSGIVSLIIGVIFGTAGNGSRKLKAAQSGKEKLQQMEYAMLAITRVRSFGREPGVKLQKMRNERNALIQKVLGAAAPSNLKRSKTVDFGG